MSMMASQILRFVDSPKIQKFKYLGSEMVTFLGKNEKSSIFNFLSKYKK